MCTTEGGNAVFTELLRLLMTCLISYLFFQVGSLLISRVSFCNLVENLLFQNLIKATKIFFCTIAVGTCSQSLNIMKIKYRWCGNLGTKQPNCSSLHFFSQWLNRFSNCYWQFSEGYISYSGRLRSSWYCRHRGSLRLMVFQHRGNLLLDFSHHKTAVSKLL